MKHARNLGFTLIELMFVVAILGVLTVVATASYKSYIRKARNQEAIAFLMDVKMKQETYFMTYSQFVDTSTTTEDFFPTLNFVPDRWLPSGSSWDCASPSSNAMRGFCALGIMPKQEMTYFQYVVIGWQPGDTIPAASPQGPWVQNANRRWWFARARTFSDDTKSLATEFRMNSELSEVYEVTY